MDDDLEPDHQRQEMERVIGILTPLRQHRQTKAERVQRQALAHLESLRTDLHIAKQNCHSERDHQRLRRQSLSDNYSRKAIAMKEVSKWNHKEQRMLNHLALIQQKAAQLEQQVEEQLQLVDSARLALRESQRAVEKLACMNENLMEF